MGSCASIYGCRFLRCRIFSLELTVFWLLIFLKKEKIKLGGFDSNPSNHSITIRNYVICNTYAFSLQSNYVQDFPNVRKRKHRYRIILYDRERCLRINRLLTSFNKFLWSSRRCITVIELSLAFLFRYFWHWIGCTNWRRRYAKYETSGNLLSHILLA